MSTKIPSTQDTRSLDVAGILARFGMAAVWLWSGYTKFIDTFGTTQSILAYELFSNRQLVNFLAVALPVTELLLGALLLVGVFLRASSWVGALLMLVFIVGIAQAWARGLTIDCGCFGTGGENPDVTATTYIKELIRDAIFLAASLYTARRPFTRFALHP